MEICALCQKIEATKTNSHIIPFFLIKEAISKAGETKRDYEVTFSIYDHFTTAYFGRNILPEKIEEINGQEIDPDKLNVKNPFALDYFLCPGCEKRFGILESAYEKSTYNLLKKANRDLMQDLNELKLSVLFAYSIFWRCNVTSFNSFSLKKDMSEKIRRILDTVLHDEDKAFWENIKLLNVDALLYKVISCFFMQDEKDDPTRNLVKITNSQMPYFFVLNRMCFQLFEKEKHILTSQEYRYKLPSMFSSADVLTHYKNRIYLIPVLSNEEREKFIQCIYDDTASSVIKNIINTFSQGYRRLFREAPSDKTIATYFTLLATNGKSEFVQYTADNLIESAVELFNIIARNKGLIK